MDLQCIHCRPPAPLTPTNDASLHRNGHHHHHPSGSEFSEIAVKTVNKLKTRQANQTKNYCKPIQLETWKLGLGLRPRVFSPFFPKESAGILHMRSMDHSYIEAWYLALMPTTSTAQVDPARCFVLQKHGRSVRPCKILSGSKSQTVRLTRTLATSVSGID